MDIAKVADFGMSRSIGVMATHLTTKSFGTVTHMPPELLMHNQLKRAGDVYAFGVMCKWMHESGLPIISA